MNMMTRRNAYRTRQPEWLPMQAVIMREAKGLYCAIIVFTKSKREYGQEVIAARTKREAKRKLKLMYPHIKFRK